MYEIKNLTAEEVGNAGYTSVSSGLYDEQMYGRLKYLYSDKPLDEVLDDLEKLAELEGDNDVRLTREDVFGKYGIL